MTSIKLWNSNLALPILKRSSHMKQLTGVSLKNQLPISYSLEMNPTQKQFSLTGVSLKNQLPISRVNQELYPGDRVRVGEFARATLLLRDDSVVPIKELTTIKLLEKNAARRPAITGVSLKNQLPISTFTGGSSTPSPSRPA